MTWAICGSSIWNGPVRAFAATLRGDARIPAGGPGRDRQAVDRGARLSAASNTSGRHLFRRRDRRGHRGCVDRTFGLMVISHGSTRGLCRGQGRPARGAALTSACVTCSPVGCAAQGGRVRIQTELTDTEIGAVVHSERFDGISGRPVGVAGPDHEPDRFDHRAARTRCRAPASPAASGQRTWMPMISCFVPSDLMSGSTRTISTARCPGSAKTSDRARSQLRQGLCHGGQMARVNFRARLVCKPAGGCRRPIGWRSEAIARDSGDALALALCGHHKAFLFRDYAQRSRCSIALWPPGRTRRWPGT